LNLASDAGKPRSHWLEVLRGDAPILLIAPHGGRAGEAARATMHPKVNDLETAAMTRELAARLEATAVINYGMDRNELDCNRLSQIVAREPWLIDLLADEVAAIVERHDSVTVLLIHGWNIIEPRVDFGLGVRERNGRLHPPRGAHVSASDEFISGTVLSLAERLREVSIEPTFGLRYPGGGAQNLLQAFTPRHGDGSGRGLDQLALLAAAGQIEAMQLELSVAVRMAGRYRDELLKAMADTFRPSRPRVSSQSSIEVVRTVTPIAPKKSTVAPAPIPPFRIGIEFYDVAERVGGMASFDFGPNAAGGRIMMLSEGRRVALFTGEGGAVRNGNSVSLGPLVLDASPRNGGLHFRGPAVVVDEGTAYLSVEGALAQGRLDPAMEVDATLEFDANAAPFGELLVKLDAAIELVTREHLRLDTLADAVPPHSTFGRLNGSVVFNGVPRRLNAIARVGVSFTGLGARKFVERQMLWACIHRDGQPLAVELRSLLLDSAERQRTAYLLREGLSVESALLDLELQTASPYEPPERIAAAVAAPHPVLIEGTADTFMTLSRPGPDGTRIHTSLGFAAYRIDGALGAGMYEYSKRAPALEGSEAGETEED